ETLPGIKMVVPVRDTEQRVQRGSTRAGAAKAIGTTPELFDVVNLRTARGNRFTQVQYDRGEPVCVLGNTVARQLFPYQDPIGETVIVGTPGLTVVVLNVVGVLEPTGLRAGSEGAAMMALDPDQGCYFPLTVARANFSD